MWYQIKCLREIKVSNIDTGVFINQTLNSAENKAKADFSKKKLHSDKPNYIFII